MENLDRAFVFAQRLHSVTKGDRQRAGLARPTALTSGPEHGASHLLPCPMLKLKKDGDVMEILEQQLAVVQRKMLAESQARLSAPLPEEQQKKVDLCLARLNALDAWLAGAGGAGERYGRGETIRPPG